MVAGLVANKFFNVCYVISEQDQETATKTKACGKDSKLVGGSFDFHDVYTELYAY